MIVFAADFVGMISLPTERHPELLVHPDAMTTTLISFESLQAVARWGPEIRKPLRDVQHLQLSTNGQRSFGIRRASFVDRSRNKSTVVSSAND